MKKSITLFLLIFFAMGNLVAQRELQIAGTIKSIQRYPSHIQTWYQDADKDGYGNPAVSSGAYKEGYVQNNEDCDDTDDRINPNTVWAIDRDGDGYGDPKEQKVQCERPQGYVKYKAGKPSFSEEKLWSMFEKQKEKMKEFKRKFKEDLMRQCEYIEDMRPIGGGMFQLTGTYTI